MADHNLRVACVQLTSTPDRDANLAQASDYIRQAAAQGAQMITLPEYVDLMVDATPKRLIGAQTQDENIHLKAYRDLARELSVWILVGSLGIKIADDKIINRSFLLSDQGEIVQSYDKKHMFDVKLATGHVFQESKCVQSGPQEAVPVAQTPWGKAGMSICFDVRFPDHFQALAGQGAEIIMVPAAYSIPTGTESWDVFLRARAMETMCFVIAPAQCGVHEGARETYGRSSIVGPDGRMIAQAVTEPGLLIADLDMREAAQRRESFPTVAAHMSS